MARCPLIRWQAADTLRAMASWRLLGGFPGWRGMVLVVMAMALALPVPAGAQLDTESSPGSGPSSGPAESSPEPSAPAPEVGSTSDAPVTSPPSASPPTTIPPVAVSPASTIPPLTASPAVTSPPQPSAPPSRRTSRAFRPLPMLAPRHGLQPSGNPPYRRRRRLADGLWSGNAAFHWRRPVRRRNPGSFLNSWCLWSPKTSARSTATGRRRITEGVTPPASWSPTSPSGW